MREIVTILCVTALTAWAAWLMPKEAKDFVIPAVTGLVGYLSREIKENVLK